MLLLSIFILAILPGITKQRTTDKCTETLNNCACKTANGYINLEALDQAKNGGTPRYNLICDRIYSDNTFLVLVKPCIPLMGRYYW